MTRISLDCQFRTLFQNGVCKLCVTLQFCLFLCRWKGFMLNSPIDFVIAAKGKLPCYLCRRPLQIQRQDRPHIDGVLSRSLNSNSWESTHDMFEYSANFESHEYTPVDLTAYVSDREY